MKKIWMKIALMMIVISLILSATMGSLLLYSNNTLVKSSLNSLDKVLREGFDRSIRWEVETAVSIVGSIDALVEQGVITSSQADTVAEHMIREARYGETGYFWVDSSDGTNIILLGKDAEGKNRFELQDVKGNYLIKDIISNSKKDGGGYTDYWFPKAGGEEALPKRGYSLFYPDKDWVIGSGNYTDDIDLQLNDYAKELEHTVNQSYFHPDFFHFKPQYLISVYTFYYDIYSSISICHMS